jgi:cell division protein FtsX
MNDLLLNDLHTWLSKQHHGLRTFRTFQQKLDDLSNGAPEQRAMCRLLNSIVASYVDTFDEAPLPVAVADRAYQRLLEMVASLDFDGTADRRLADINRVAALDLRH